MTDDLENLRRAHAELPEGERDVFDRARFDGQSYAEIAAALGIDSAEVERLLVSAMRRLRIALYGE